MKIYICDTVKQEIVETVEGDAEKAMEVAEGYCEKGEKVRKHKIKTQRGREGVRLITPSDYEVMYLLER